MVRGKGPADLSPLLLQLLDARDAAVPYAAQWHVLPAAEGCGSSGAATGRATGWVSIGLQAACHLWPLERGRGCERRASAAADAGGPDAREPGQEAPTARLNLAAACGRRRAGRAAASAGPTDRSRAADAAAAAMTPHASAPTPPACAIRCQHYVAIPASGSAVRVPRSSLEIWTHFTVFVTQFCARRTWRTGTSSENRRRYIIRRHRACSRTYVVVDLSYRLVYSAGT